ncbi:MAG TPA: YdcF family protein [Candidatus Angelobacter sp.]|nr:YdcF family protein [Candidatus Angelobacter sp.]
MAARFLKKWPLWLLLAIGLYFAAIYRNVVGEAGGDRLQPADAIVVFGAAEYDGRPSPVYKARLDYAAQLYSRGLARIVITTGGAGADPHFSEGEVGRDYLRAQGVPDTQLIAETQSSDTAESARRVANIMRANHMNSCLAVSDGYHMFRIRRMLGHQGITVLAAPRPNSKPPSFWKRESAVWHEIGSYSAWVLHLT